jgi:hypothetical protein
MQNILKPSETQKEIILSADKNNAIIQSCPGSGKTTSIL